MKIFYIIFIILTVFEIINAENIRINITNGPILGRIGRTIGQNKLLYIFQGVPYAEPPKRFEIAVEKGPWTKDIDCTYDKSECVQGSDPVTGSEDCLTLSVYSPDLSGSYPVLTWIHGGYFTIGNGSYQEVPPDYIVDEDVVFVAVQYRLGIFGFMSTGDKECPGNLGLKDQLLALQWVQKNIKYFGGNPNMVTLGGQSSGAVCASLHLQSPLSQGLFQAVILNSGSSLNLWGLSRKARETAFTVGISLNIAYTTSKTLMIGLKKINYKELQKASVTSTETMLLENPLSGLTFGYVKEPQHKEAFFTGKSEQKLSKGNFTKVPILLGVNSNEALFFGNITLLVRGFLFKYNFDYTKLVPADLTTSFWNKYWAGLEIKSNFFNTELIGFNDSDLMAYIDSDQFERPIWQFGLDVSKYVENTYFYQFSYEGPTGQPFRTSEGVGHSEDLNYLFFKPKENTTAADLLTSNRFVRLWSNFVKHWNPTPGKERLLENITWLPMYSRNLNETYYMNFDSKLEIITKNLKEENFQFWNDPASGIYPRYGQGIYDTY